jgi:branched-chain amino acid transport system substrate-binding protein
MSGPKLPVRNPCRVILTKWRSMSTLRRSHQFGCLFLCYFGMGVPELSAQGPGVTEHEIAIGSCAALEGPSSFLGRETVAGAQTYFDLINEEGGVNGRKLHLYSFDDSYDPAKAQGCWDKLMAQKVFALGFFVGTPTAAKYVPWAESKEIPLVGLFTGAQTLYVPLRRWVIR